MWKAVSWVLLAVLLCSCAAEKQPYNRGIAYARQGDQDRAIQEFTRAIELKPGFSRAYVGRGIAHLQKRELDPALEDFTSAIRLDSKDA